MYVFVGKMSIQALCSFLNSIIIIIFSIELYEFFTCNLDITPYQICDLLMFSLILQVVFSIYWLFALLCQSSSVWCSSICLLWLLLAVLLVSYLINHCLDQYWASQVVLVVKNMPANSGDKKRGSDTWVRKILWRRAWQLTPVFLPGELHGQRSLVGHSP